jgi:predicted O-methyltransferase YrrM
LKEIAGGIDSAGSGVLRQRSDSEGEGAAPDQDREFQPPIGEVRNGEATASDRQSLVLQRESEIAALAEALRQRGLQLSSIEEVVRTREGEVSAAADLLRLRESTIASLEDQLGRKGAEIEDVVGLVRLREATIGDLEDLVRSKESEIAALAEAVAQREWKLSSTEEVVRKREEEVSAAAELLRLRELTITSLEDQVERRGAEIEDIAGLLHLREATIRHLEDVVRLSESEIAASAEVLRQRDLQLSSIEEIAKKREEEVSAAADLVRLRESTITSLEDHLRRRNADIEDVAGLLRLREATIVHLEDVVRLRESEILSACSIVRLREERISSLESLLAEPAAHAAPEWRALPLDEKVSRCLETIDGWCSPKKAAWLARLIVSRQVANVLEIGIFGGKSLIPMALAVQSGGGGTVIGVEPWSPDIAISEPTNEANDAWWASIDFALIKERFFANCARYGVVAMTKVMEMDSDSAFRFLKPRGRQFDLVHIDGAHSPERALGDAKSWSKLVKKGGLVVFDDIAWPSVASARDFLTRNLTVIDEVFESGEGSYGAYEVKL